MQTFSSDPQDFMNLALEEAKKAFQENEVPIGAVLVKDNQVIAKACNTREKDKDPFQHAEMKVLQEGAKHEKDWRLNDYELYVSLEPCPMCLGAIFQARVGKLYFGAFDEKRAKSFFGEKKVFLQSLKTFLPHGQGELVSNNHILQVHGGLQADLSQQLLKKFFLTRRNQDKK